VSILTIALFAEGSAQPDKFNSNIIKSVKFVLFYFFQLLSLFLLAGDKILLLFGDEYSKKSLFLLQLLVLSCIPMVLSKLCSNKVE